ncbi:hypothetical protein G6F57_001843 [Rhizopus arrhizus]|uniref:Uncharacterized protein n=1 Tax=Rhizopus oryzae TaxID=64495 RepID=A0A9P6XEQ9_RHIOR|nr:hypothetical protein G6F23_001134 [Rhizopus arrhizus]KAG1423281.1 hypothetical protein G6F58_002879 [Rhizopus delemar]KAG0767470.1 hypothetical protein G6F24_002766 [Rhizopus arrhizus]KAG0790705.1 hypothetical protein G6F21_005610 [Rhizopus arrhizus]KAG0799003.1 hypothetical protein G6F22_003660 [Rhizopus arrhizus]
MRLLLSTRLVLFTIALFQLFLSVTYCQFIPSARTTIETTTTERPLPPISSVVPIVTTRTTIAPRPAISHTSTTTTLSTLQPPSSISRNTVAISATTTTTTTRQAVSSIERPSSIVRSSSTSIVTRSSTTSASSSLTTSVTSSISSAPSANSINFLKEPTDTTPILIGSIVGGIDYGLSDFPQQRKPTLVTNKHVSPTLPKLNEQGNYYRDDYNYYGHHQGDYGMQPSQHGAYGYPQQHPEYYEDGGYYYDNNPEMTSTAYSPPPIHQFYNSQEYFVNNNMGHPSLYQQQNAYKPDDIETPVIITDGRQSKVMK